MNPSSRTEPQTRRQHAIHFRRLSITIVSGVGTGPTAVAAFDAALRDASIANYNLLPLSSVIPACSEIIVSDDPPALAGTWGDRLYLVIAERRVTTPDQHGFAGIGWVQEPASGKGLFVEHIGTSREQVESDIEASLAAMCAGRPTSSFGPVQRRVEGVACRDQPVCALVAAVYDTAPW